MCSGFAWVGLCPWVVVCECDGVRELSLFSGAGGGLLAGILLGWRPVGYVEWDDYCQRVLRARIDDGYLPDAPIFGDIRAFLSEGYARRYRGMVDVLTAGFPCQPFSAAGKRRGADDERNMWPATIDCINVVRPRRILLENVSALLAHEYAREIFGQLAESGYDCRWRVLSAAELGAPHRRDRLWIYGDSDCNNESQERGISSGMQAKSGRSGIDGYADSESQSTEPKHAKMAGLSNVVADATRFQQGRKKQRAKRERVGSGGKSGEERKVADADSARSEEWERAKSAKTEHTGINGNGWWTVEPNVGRVANGVPNRVGRLKALGNGQVPAVAQAAWEILS